MKKKDPLATMRHRRRVTPLRTSAVDMRHYAAQANAAAQRDIGFQAVAHHQTVVGR